MIAEWLGWQALLLQPPGSKPGALLVELHPSVVLGEEIESSWPEGQRGLGPPPLPIWTPERNLF